LLIIPQIDRCLLCLTIIIILSLISCKTDTSSDPEQNSILSISGRTMGTSYHISYTDSTGIDYKKAIDSILLKINQSVSTYIPSSTISRINQDSIWKSVQLYQDGKYTNFQKIQLALDTHFIRNYQTSKDVYVLTQGYFDPTVMPLVNYWGFGYKPKKAITQIDSQRISDIIQFVGFDMWSETITESRMDFVKPMGAQIDFSAIAKGYAVDIISHYLENNNIQNYLVEIGGEVYCKGQKRPEQPWTIALSKPQTESAINDVQEALSVHAKGVASSGNYRNYYEVDGKMYGHEIHPETGYPEINDLLGVTVVADNCMIADAYATAFMIMGREKAENAAEKLGKIEAIFFYSDNQGQIQKSLSSGFQQYLK